MNVDFILFYFIFILEYIPKKLFRKHFLEIENTL